MYQLCELIHFLGILNHFTPNQIYFLSTKIHQVFIIAICKKYIDAGYETFYHLGGLVIFQTMFVYCGIFYRSVVPIVVLDEVFYCLLHIIRQSPLAENIFLHSHQFVLEISWQQFVEVAYYVSYFLDGFWIVAPKHLLFNGYILIFGFSFDKA